MGRSLVSRGTMVVKLLPVVKLLLTACQSRLRVVFSLYETRLHSIRRRSHPILATAASCQSIVCDGQWGEFLLTSP